MLKKSASSFLLVVLIISLIVNDKIVEADDSDTLKTGLEIRNDGSWTTHEEELEFLQELSDKSDMVEYEVYGETAEGRPLHLVKVGKNAAKSNDEIAEGRNILIVGTFHGNEPSGREMSLKTMRDLAFTDDEDMLDLMSKSTILFLPTVNPDGREANRRRNGDNYDLNRDAVRLITPEGQTLAKIQNEFQPDIVLDAHERMGGPNMSLLGNMNRTVDTDLKDLNDQLIEDYMFKDLESEGFEHTYYPASEKAYPTNTRGISGFRHSIGILTEGSWEDEPLERVAAQMVSVNSILRFYEERFDEIGEVVANSRKNRQEAGAKAEDPFYLEGIEDTEVENESAILDPPPYGYVINERQKERIETQIDLFSIKLEEIENGYYVTMDQEMMTIIPYIMDENSRTKLINGDRVTEKPIIDDLKAPNNPEPKQYKTDFSEYEEGEVPNDWTEPWAESQWVAKDKPSRLEHVVSPGENPRLLTWDKVGEVHGDVELATLVRTDREGKLFQVHLNAYGTEDSTDSYYLEVKNQHGKSEIEINREIGSLYKSLEKETLPFDVEVDTWYQIVFQREGESLKGKVWEYGDEEPDWQISIDDVYMDFGSVGVGHETNGVVNDWKHFSVGTYGEEAVRAPNDLFEDVDKSVLERRINKIKDENLIEEDYLVESWETLQVALETAESVLNNDTATQEEVDQATKNLYEAYSGLSAQYEVNFKDYETGSSPEDWSMLWRESQWKVQSDPNRLEHVVTEGSGRRGLTWDKPGDITGDVELYTLVRKSNTTSGVMFQLHLQATGLASSESSYYLDVTNSGKIRINRNKTGGFSSLKSASIPSSNELDTWYEVVFKREGSKLLGKAWRYGEEEPGDWQIEVEDDNFFNGKVGLGHVTNDVINDYAFFSVGTGEADAPRAPKDLLVDTTPLENKVNEIEGYDLIESDYSSDSWVNLQNALNEAKKMIEETDGLNQADIMEMINRLEEAYAGLQTAGAQYETSFSEYTTDEVPYDWSVLWRESGWNIAENPSRLEHFVTPGGKRRVLTWDEVGEVQGDVEIAGLVKASDVTGKTMFQLHLNGTGDAGSESSYYLDLRTTDAVRINRNRNGGFSSLKSEKLPFEAEENVWYNAVLNFKDNTLRGKVWPYGEEEPEEWQIEVEDENFSAGKVGVGHVSSGVTNEWAYFSVGINDEPALRAPSDLLDPDEPEVDKSALESLVAEIEDENLDESDYTADSWGLFQSAFESSVAVLEDEDATQESVDQALEDLELAYEGLEEVEDPPVDEVDKSALEVLVAEIEAEDLDESDYTTDSWTAFEKAFESSLAVLEDEGATQESVDQAFEELESAYGGLEEVEDPPVDEVDKSALEALVAEIEAEDLDESDYTEDSWELFQSAFESSLSILEDEDATQESVDQVFEELESAYEGLEAVESPPVDEVDKSALETLVAEIEAEDLDESDYTTDSWTAFETAFESSLVVLEDEGATQESVDQAFEELESAYESLESIESPPVDEVDKSALEALVAEIEAEDLDESDYTADSWVSFETAFESSIAVLEDEDATQESVDQAFEALESAYGDLEEVEDPPVDEVDKSALEALIAEIEAEELDESDYTADSWKLFQSAFESSVAVLKDEDATQESVDQAFEELESAYAGLKEIESPPVDEVDKSALESLVAEIEAKELDESNYTTDSWTAFETAFESSLAVLEDEDATQESVDQSFKDLESAYEGLEELESPPVDEVDKSALEALVAEIEAEELNESDYTAESWGLFQSAFESAVQVLSSSNVSDENVSDSFESLLQSYEGLVKVQESDDESQVEEPVESPSETVPDEEENLLPKTATSIYEWMLYGVALLLLGAIMLVVRRKYNL